MKDVYTSEITAGNEEGNFINVKSRQEPVVLMSIMPKKNGNNTMSEAFGVLREEADNYFVENFIPLTK